MRLGKGKRRLLAALGFVLVIPLLIVISIPLWLPWGLKPFAAGKGLRFTMYERKGYSRFVLGNVTFTNADLQLQAKRAEALTPGVWLWRSFRGHTGGAAPFLRVEDWQLELADTNQQPANGESSTYTDVVDVERTLRVVRRWLPTADLSRGALRSGTTSIQFSSAVWRDGDLLAAVEWPQQKQHGVVKASLKEMPFTAQIVSETAKVEATIMISAKQDGLALRGQGLWEMNRFDWDAHFGKNGSLPDEASIRAMKFRVPGKIARVPYENISGDLVAGWTNGSFALEVAAAGTPSQTTTNVPPAEVRVKARGDTNVAVIESAVIRSPWLQADVSQGATLHFSGRMLREPASVSLRADLDRQPWIKLRGMLAGKADLQPSDGKYPQAIFQLSGTNIGSAEIEAKRFMVEGSVHWPLIEISRGEGTLDDGSYARLSGEGNAEAKAVTNGKLQFAGPAGGRWLPAGYGYENGIVDVEFAGPLTNLSHSAHAIITNVTLPQLKPLRVKLDWEGQDTKLNRVELEITTGEATLAARFAAEVKRPADTNSPLRLHCEVALDKLDWKKGSEETFSLQKPARVLLENFAASSNAWHGEVGDFRWSGKGGDIEINGSAAWPESGNFGFLVQELRADVLNSFAQQPVEPAKIHEMRGRVGWTNGPLVFEVQARAEAPLESKDLAQASKSLNLGSVSAGLSARGDGNGVTITNFLIRSETSQVAVASGLVPVTFVPASRSNFVQLDTKTPLDFTLRTEPESLFWRKFSEWTGVTLQEPELRAHISGTWEKPQGRAQLRAAQIKLPATQSNLPVMEHLELDLGLDREFARLTNITLLVQGQRVMGSGEFPLGEQFWTDLRQKKPPNWEKATARLQIADAQISAFAGLFPALLAPQGTFHLDVSLVPGGKLDGQLALKDARTRPLPSVGPIRDIAVMMRFAGRTVKLGEITATIGGSPVTAAGEGDLSGTDWLKGVPPPFEFVLYGTNVPLSRQPGSIIRSDLNLTIKNTNGAPPLISGNVWLRNSYYLSDLGDLVPGKVSTPQKRPPYFGIEEPGLAKWRLAVRVGGERGLRVRSTLFSGEVSPNLRLQGTLKEPLALGDVKIENGIVKFPFASLDVQRGFVTLTSEDPYRPHLMVSASSKKFGYDVRMELTGPADQPIIQFSSTPPLSSEQLVLMVTAGELPKGGYTLNPQQRAQTMALFLGKDLLSKLGFGDDSKERLTFSSGQEISETGKPTYSVEYKWTDRWSLVGEYDRFNAFNAGVKWKVYSK